MSGVNLIFSQERKQKLVIDMISAMLEEIRAIRALLPHEGDNIQIRTLMSDAYSSLHDAISKISGRENIYTKFKPEQKEVIQLDPAVGWIVHYRVSETDVRPAIIVHVWNPDMVNLQVFIDGANDRPELISSLVCFSPEEQTRGIAWKTSVHQGDRPGEWQCPTRT